MCKTRVKPKVFEYHRLFTELSIYSSSVIQMHYFFFVCVLVGGMCGGECQPSGRSHLDEEQPVSGG